MLKAVLLSIPVADTSMIKECFTKLSRNFNICLHGCICRGRMSKCQLILDCDHYFSTHAFMFCTQEDVSNVLSGELWNGVENINCEEHQIKMRKSMMMRKSLCKCNKIHCH